MNIYGAQNHAKKLHAFVSSFLTNNVSTYYTTRARLYDVAMELKEAYTDICEVLDIQDKLPEIKKPSVQKVQRQRKVVKPMESGTMTLNLKTRGTDEVVKTVVLADTKTPKQDDEAVVETVKEEKSSPMKSSRGITPKEKENALREYSLAFKEVKQTLGISDAARECATMLSTWFDSRFMNTSDKNSDFKYNAKYLPNWTQYMVLMYANSREVGSEKRLVKSIERWASRVETEGNKYAVPFELYNYMKIFRKSDITPKAIELWSELVKCGLHRVCRNDSPIYIRKVICDTTQPTIFTETRNKIREALLGEKVRDANYTSEGGFNYENTVYADSSGLAVSY